MSSVGWERLVIGTGRPSSGEPGAGKYDFWRLKQRTKAGVVTAEVVPDMSGQGENQPHLWGVKFPAVKATTRKDADGNEVIDRPALPAYSLGGKESSRQEAFAAAEAAIRLGKKPKPTRPPVVAIADEPPDDA